MCVLYGSDGVDDVAHKFVGSAASVTGRPRARRFDDLHIGRDSLGGHEQLAVPIGVRRCRQRRVQFLEDPIEMLLKPFGRFEPLLLLQFHHDAQRLSRLMRPKLVDQVMYVDEEQVEVLDLLLALGRVRSSDEDVEQIEKVHQDRVIEFLEFALVIEVLRIETLEALRFEWPDDEIVGAERLTEHGVRVVDRRWRERWRRRWQRPWS